MPQFFRPGFISANYRTFSQGQKEKFCENEYLYSVYTSDEQVMLT
jgi:hypothetical protein